MTTTIVLLIIFMVLELACIYLVVRRFTRTGIIRERLAKTAATTPNTLQVEWKSIVKKALDLLEIEYKPVEDDLEFSYLGGNFLLIGMPDGPDLRLFFPSIYVIANTDELDRPKLLAVTASTSAEWGPKALIHHTENENFPDGELRISLVTDLVTYPNPEIMAQVLKRLVIRQFRVGSKLVQTLDSEGFQNEQKDDDTFPRNPNLGTDIRDAQLN